MKHWATPLVGTPYGDAPGQLRCFTLLRHVFLTRFGIELPSINMDAPILTEVLAAARASGWRPLPTGTRPEEDDVAFMRDAQGGRHVGIVVWANGMILILHAVQRAGVIVERLDDLPLAGFKDIEYWRRA